MAKNLIERAEEPRTAWNEHDGAPAILKHAANIIQRSQVVRQVLDHIQTDDGVKFLFLGKRFAVLAVGITHAHVWPVQADIFKIRQVQRINVAGPIHPARNQLQCQIANACADFQYFFSHIGTDDVGHPLGEARRTVQAAERSEEHTSELQSLTNLVCRLLLEKKKK